MLIANLEEAISEQGAEQVRIPPLFYIHSTFIDAVFDLRSPCVRPVLGRFPAVLTPNSCAQIGCMIAEPIMGAGGCIVPPPGYLRRCQQLCRANDIIFIADEVVTAFGRLGHYFASEAVFGIEPDIICFAKGVTSGYQPLGGLLISGRIDHRCYHIIVAHLQLHFIDRSYRSMVSCIGINVMHHTCH